MPKKKAPSKVLASLPKRLARSEAEIREDLEQLSTQAIDILQEFAVFGDILEVKFLEDALPEAESYKLEMNGLQFRLLMSLLGKAKTAKDRLVAVSIEAGIKPTTFMEWIQKQATDSKKAKAKAKAKVMKKVMKKS